MSITPPHEGAVTLKFMKPDGAPMMVRICRHDPSVSAPPPVAKTRLYDVFLANNGHGQGSTDEYEGRVALGLARVIEQNEIRARRLSVGTLRERLTSLGRRLA
jgi:hypothetical protein